MLSLPSHKCFIGNPPYEFSHSIKKKTTNKNHQSLLWIIIMSTHKIKKYSLNTKIMKYQIKTKQKVNICHQKYTANPANTISISNFMSESPKSQLSTHLLQPDNIQHNNITSPFLPYHESSTNHLPIRRFDHSLDKFVSDHHIQHLRHVCETSHLNADCHFSSIYSRMITSTSVSSLLQLLTCDSPINDSVINTFLSTVCATQTEILSLDTNFHRILRSQGWQYAYHTFFLHKK
jgi:hypothetical protein